MSNGRATSCIPGFVSGLGEIEAKISLLALREKLLREVFGFDKADGRDAKKRRSNPGKVTRMKASKRPSE